MELSVYKYLINYDYSIKPLIELFSFLFISADGMTYSFGIFYVEFLKYFNEGKGYTAWIASILVGVTLCSGKHQALRLFLE